MNWFKWFGHLVWQPSHDDRVDQVQREVEAIKRGMGDLKELTAELNERTAALEAFRQLAEDSSK